MQGQSWVCEAEVEMHDTFAVFRVEKIDFKMLSLMIQVVKFVSEIHKVEQIGKFTLSSPTTNSYSPLRTLTCAHLSVCVFTTVLH